MGFFGETELMGILEAYDYDSADIVSPFIGAIVDGFCGLFEIAEVTKTLTEYVDLVH